ncbi:twin-arginine translocation signal domain-containing protein [Sphaerisporangium perillae]|uniref:twin-arginine translocation signal domain-containing protein n=1 Tax=Sphaerisporangium perillae TaxID=2935860 RepID=UPI00200F3B45|nr:twin-arginine translocation signal domain-containing protein [Sphaerisporangium perillae]
MRQRALTRRAVLRGTAAGALAAAVAGCSGEQQAPPSTPKPPDPETVLLTSVIADKEQMVALYRQAAGPGGKTAARLRPFQQRHEAHLAELRRRLPAAATPSASSPAPSGSASSGGSASPAAVSVGRLREMERKAAAARPRQMGTVSPALAQLLASIGACEAAHAAALARAS